MSHEVSIDPIDDSGINVSNLEQRRNLWVPGTAIHPDHFSHPPVASIGMGLTPQKATESREKAGGAAFGQYLDRHPFWNEVLKEEIKGLKPYSLRHGFAWRSALYTPIAIRTAARLMGHDVRTHMKHYGHWIDDQDMEKEVDAANMAVAATLSKRQQQMQQQQ